MMKIPLWFVAVPLLAVVFLSTAGRLQSQTPDSLPDYLLEEVTVTTTRTTTARDQTPRRIDVVTPTDIERSGSRSIGEALRGNVAIDAIEYPGLLTGVSIRGFRPQFSGINPRTLILVDGRPAGTNNLALLHGAGVERIEVLRGPASALYGPNAMGGVVNVVRRRSSGEISSDVDLGYGSFGSYEGRLTTGGFVTKGIDFDLSLAATGQMDGYRTGSGRSADSLLKTLPDGETVRLPWTRADSVLDHSRFATRSVNGRIGTVLVPGWRADLALEAFRADDVENPGDLNVSEWDSRTLKDASRQSVDLRFSGSSGRNAPMVRAYAATERTDYYSGADDPNFINFRTPIRTFGGQVQNVIDLAPFTIVGGVDYTVAEATSERFSEAGVRAAPFSPDSRISAGAAFAEGRVDFLDERLGATLGLRFDRIDFSVEETPHLLGFPANTERSEAFTPSAGLKFKPVPRLQVYANVGKGFVTPDAFQVAGYSEARAGQDRQSVFVTRGNPALRPENSWSFDGGVALLDPAAGIDLDVAYFRTDVEDRIASIVTPGSGQLTIGGDTILSTTTPVNADDAEIRGIEARAAFDLAHALGANFALRMFLNGTAILRAKERFEASGTSQRIRNVAARTVIAGIEYDDVRMFTGRLSARYVGERFDTDYVAWWEPGEIRYPPYLVLDLHLGVRIADRYRFRVDVRNLSDEDYFEVRGYNLPGRSLRIGLGATLK